MTLLLRDISHRYGAIEAVSGVSLEVGAGEIVCLFGPSGCGKTTLMRLVAGLERLQSGSIKLDGAPISGGGVDIPPEKRAIGLVFQEYVLFPHMTAAGNVAFGIGGPDRRKRAREELTSVGLDGFEDRYPHQLSGGQQQRVALARALVRRPRAMLLDEPFASVDSTLRRRLREELRRILKESSAPTLLVTHDPEEALALGDRIAVMKEGRIIEAASPQALFERPATAEGATIFAGSQTLKGHSDGAMVRTAFGDVHGKLAAGKATVVILPGGVSIVQAAHASASVVGNRFVGPGWLVELAAPNGERLFAPSPAPCEAGSFSSVALDATLAKVFAA